MWARFLVGPIPTTIDGSATFSLSSPSSTSTATAYNHLLTPSSILPLHHCSRLRKRFPEVVAASSSSSSSLSAAAIGGEADHYTVLGVARNATSADIKKAYRLLARKYHPDVSKHSQGAELFKSIHNAYEILSNEVTRIQYDHALRFREYTGRLYNERTYYNPEYEDGVRAYRWAELLRKMHREWYKANDENSSSYRGEGEEEAKEGNMDQRRGPFSEVLRSAFISLFLLQVFGSRLSLAFSSLMALFDGQLDAGYKIGYLIAWILGGRGGILLTLSLQFASWVCGKKSSSMVALVVVAMWVCSNLARFAPLPQGALITLLYMSIKLQGDLS